MKAYQLRVIEGLFTNMAASWLFASVAVLVINDLYIFLGNLIAGMVCLVMSLFIASKIQR